MAIEMNREGDTGKKMKLVLVVILTFCACVSGWSQSWDVLYDSAEVNYKLGNYNRASFFAQKAHDQIKKELGDSNKNLGTALNDLALVYENMGQYNQALPMYLEALKYVEMKLGSDHSNYGITQFNLARLYVRMGQKDKALPLYEGAVQNAEKNLSKGLSYYGMFLYTLADVYENLGQYNKALPLLLKVRENAENTLGKGNAEYGMYLNNLASLYEKIGLYEKSLPLYLELLKNTESVLGKKHTYYGNYLNNLAGLYEKMGQYDKALPLFSEARENVARTLGENHPNYAICLNNLAGLYESMGQYGKALSLYQESLKITEQTLGKNHVSYGIRQNNLALLYEKMGLYEKALPLFLNALNIAENTMGKSHSAYSMSLINLGGIYCSMGQYENALPLYQYALENVENTLGKDHPLFGTCQNHLGFLYVRIGKKDKALPLYECSLKNADHTLGKNHPQYGVRLNNLAVLYETMGEVDKAYPLYNQGIELLMNQVENNFSFIGEKEKELYVRAKTDSRFSTFRSFAHRNHEGTLGFTKKLFDAELFTTGLILNHSMQMQQRILSGNNDSAKRLFDQWILLKSELASNYAKPIAERRSDLAEVEEQANQLEGQLTRISSAFAEYKTEQRLRWTDIRDRLKPGEAAVQFSSFPYYDGKRWTDSTFYMALVLRSGDITPELVKLCEQKQLDSVLKKTAGSDAGYITSLYRGAGAESDDTHTELSHGKELYRLIWKPLESLLNENKTIYFVPSGSLHQIAFGAIPAGEGALLSDRYELRQLSAMTHLLREDEVTKPASIAVYGGIAYDAGEKELNGRFTDSTMRQQFVSRSLSEDLSRGGSWNYLPGTYDEAMAIGKIAKAKNIAVTTYSGPDAMEERYKSTATGTSPEVIHIATHGFFFPDPKTDPKRMEHQTANEFKLSDNPLNRSGLLFAGANNTWQGKPVKGVEDGILTAYEASNVPLLNTKLVTLSACETGLGDIKGSEGVFGLQRAFKMAGAEYLMMSLWKVPDAETAEFMTHFYDSWFSGKSIREAFSNTQQYMKTRYPGEPYKWAAFVLVH